MLGAEKPSGSIVGNAIKLGEFPIMLQSLIIPNCPLDGPLLKSPHEMSIEDPDHLVGWFQCGWIKSRRLEDRQVDALLSMPTG
jgi:hypothetical protein